MTEDYYKGQEVYIRDRSLGKATRVSGVIIGVLPGNVYSILLTNGLNQGNIRKYKYYEIISQEELEDE